MRVQEIMTEQVRTVPPTMRAAEAWELMKGNRIRHLVVLNGSQIVGIVSDRDVGGRSGAIVRDGKTVGDLMTENVTTVEGSTTLRRAANVMRGRTIGCLPVTDRGRLVGIVTTSNLLDVLGRGVDRPAERERPSATHRVAHRPRRSATGVW